jgi:glycosyltransferase involved in cell wall biosynthesis
MISIIIPTKNEPYIGELVSDINRIIAQKHEIIIVDKSSDQPKVSGARVIKQKSKGLGNAVLEGLKFSKGDVICMMDGDGSHDPKDLKKLIAKMPEYDIAIGSKLVKGGKTEDEFSRRIVSLVINVLSRTWLGLKQKDPSTGFMVIKRNTIEKIKLKPKGFKLVMEVLFKTKRFAKVAEVPITFHKRKAGESTVGWNMRGVKEFFRIISLIMDLRFGR